MGAGETGRRKGLKYSVKSFLWNWGPVFTRSRKAGGRLRQSKKTSEDKHVFEWEKWVWAQVSLPSWVST